MYEKKTAIAVEDANEKEIAMSIARTITARRKELNLSQRELASMCGYPKRSASILNEPTY